MSEARIISISSLKSGQIGEGKKTDNAADLPIYRGAGHDLGNGFFAGAVNAFGTTVPETYRSVFDTLLMFPAGGAAVDLPDGRVALSPLDGILLPGGVTFGCCFPDRFLFVTREIGEEYSSSLQKATVLSSRTPLGIPSATRAASAFNSPVPEQKRSEILQISENSTVGMWGSSIYHRKASEFPRFEFMFLQAGSYAARIKGETLHFQTGDLFFVEKGANASFETDGPVRKIYWSLG